MNTNKPITREPFNGKTIEQYWTDLISKNLVGRTITRVEYVSQEKTFTRIFNR